MAGSQVETDILQLQKQRLGYQGVSLTNFDNDNESQIAAGSKVEVGGALFEFAAPESITGWAGIGNNNDVYIKLTVAGVSITASFTTTPSTWSTSKQGFYDALERYIGGLYKDAGGNYTKKYLYGKFFENNPNVRFYGDGDVELLDDLTVGDVISAGGHLIAGEDIIATALRTGNTRLATHVVEIGFWNMQGTATKDVAHGLTIGNDQIGKIYRITAFIFHDNLDEGSPIERCDANGKAGGWVSIDRTQVHLARTTGGFWDSAVANADDVERGYVLIEYLP